MGTPSRQAMRRRTTGAASLAAWLVALLTIAGVAFAGSGGISPPPGGGGGDDPPPPPPPACDDGAGASGSEPDFEVAQRDASPRVDYPDDGRTTELTYTITDTSEPVDLEIQVLRDDGSNAIIKHYCPEDVPPDQAQVATWDHTTSTGEVAPKAKYKFKVMNIDGTKPATDADPNHHFQWRGHIFPLHGTPHYYGDGWGAGRGHRGTDIFESGFPSPCGAPVLAARGGFVEEKRSQAGAAGNYIVVHSNDTDRSYAYLHLQGKTLNSFVSEGETVQTGQQIATMGASGNASACHLHFELWLAPWTQYDSEPSLRKWDTWS
jgi:murein DD-endopeptidase MepM/ murein hydrolase activator NlpD